MPATSYAPPVVAKNHTQPVPQRVRATLGGETVLDSVSTIYVWEHPYFPQFYVPATDVRTEFLTDDRQTIETDQGTAAVQTLAVGGDTRRGAARLLTSSPIDGLAMTYRFDWDALDRWFEEDEEVFVHPRSPFVRVDALRSRRAVRVEIDGVVLAESEAPIMLFETGLPTRFYLEKTDIDWSNLTPTDTVTACPYKGTTSEYWTATVGDRVVTDVAWSYDFPTREVLPIAGRVAFYNEKVDILLDGTKLDRPRLPGG